jgi:glycosyltransferase involved in cell wall biosynthesis
MPSSPRVSVIIPCFNLGRFLPEAIESVRRQTFSDHEVVIVDDGSTDAETRAQLDRVTGPRTRVVRSPNRGLSAARNLGIRHSTGEYLCSLDADDMLAPTWLERGVALLDQEPEVAFVSHWLETFGDERWDWTPGRCDLAMLLDVNAVNGAALFRRAILDTTGGFDETMREGCEDWEFWIRVTEAGFGGAIIPEALYRYRRRPDSMSRVMNASETRLRLYRELVEKHPSSYREHLLDLVLRREWTIAGLAQRIDGLQQELDTTLYPALRERRLELQRAQARLADARAADALRQRVDDLERERDGALRRIEDLRRSWSWRITGPLRRLYELLNPAARPPAGGQ